MAFIVPHLPAERQNQWRVRSLINRWALAIRVHTFELSQWRNLVTQTGKASGKLQPNMRRLQWKREPNVGRACGRRITESRLMQVDELSLSCSGRGVRDDKRTLRGAA